MGPAEDRHHLLERPIAALALLGESDRISVCCDTARYPWLRHALPYLEELPNYGSLNDASIEEMVKASPDVVISPALMAEVEDRVKDIPGDERKRVLVVRSTIEEVFRANISLGHTARLAGGKLVTDEMNEYFTTVDAEQILSWAPDAIIRQLLTIDPATAAGRFKEREADERYCNLPAVQTGDTYIMPMGIAQWGGDIESGLGMLLMAKLMYPERFADMDVVEKAAEFYKEFMGYHFGEDDYAYLFVDMEGAKPLGVVD